MRRRNMTTMSTSRSKMANMMRRKMETMGETWAWLGSILASIMFVYAMFQQYFPSELRDYIKKYANRLLCLYNPNITISVYEYSSGDRFRRSEAYTAVETYLSSKSPTEAKRLKVHVGRNCKNLVFKMDDYEVITDVYQGVEMRWSSAMSISNKQTISLYPADEKRFFKLKFHSQYRDFVTRTYMSYVMEQGKAIQRRNRQIKLYTNNPSSNGKQWSEVVFDHPARFENLAMDPVKKQEIIDDLVTFSQGKDYYAKVGKVWRRGYLLYGPPGTGKSTMVAAIANFLKYDIYDLELTAVKDNNHLRKLLIGTAKKSIVVIEDIDCSLDLTGQRNKKKKKEKNEEKETDILKNAKEEASSTTESKVTLSGLLNFIDGLWSACGKERIIIFTTNYVEKLDPALIRRGRMDKHIELSYCGFEGFKVLAKNYLQIVSHDLFETIQELIEKAQMSPADVAENLIPKTVGMDSEHCLKSLIQALENVKEEAKLKKQAEEDAVEMNKAKAEEEAKLKKAEEEATDLKKKKKKKVEEEAADLKKKKKNTKMSEKKTRLKKEASKFEEGDDKLNKESRMKKLLVKQQQPQITTTNKLV